jgi:hypothetical protein
MEEVDVGIAHPLHTTPQSVTHGQNGIEHPNAVDDHNNVNVLNAVNGVVRVNRRTNVVDPSS